MPPMRSARSNVTETCNDYFSIRDGFAAVRDTSNICGPVCQKQLSSAGIINYIPQILWDVITCPCRWYLLLAHKSSYEKHLGNTSIPLKQTNRTKHRHDLWYGPNVNQNQTAKIGTPLDRCTWCSLTPVVALVVLKTTTELLLSGLHIPMKLRTRLGLEWNINVWLAAC